MKLQVERNIPNILIIFMSLLRAKRTHEAMLTCVLHAMLFIKKIKKIAIKILENFFIYRRCNKFCIFFFFICGVVSEASISVRFQRVVNRGKAVNITSPSFGSNFC